MRLGLCFCSAWCSQRQVWMATREKWWRHGEEAYQPRVCSRMQASNISAEQRACLPESSPGPAVTSSWYSSGCIFGCPETWLSAVRHPLAKGWSSAGGGHQAVQDKGGLEPTTKPSLAGRHGSTMTGRGAGWPHLQLQEPPASPEAPQLSQHHLLGAVITSSVPTLSVGSPQESWMSAAAAVPTSWLSRQNDLFISLPKPYTP